MVMDVDFPAAHSMDTLWFAVDRDGHIAALQSRSGGAAPADRPRLRGTDQEGVCEELRELLPECPVTYDLAGRIIPGPLHQGTDHAAEKISQPGAYLMFLRSLELVTQEIAAGAAVQHPATEGWAVVFRNLSPEVARKIHEAGACLACFYHADYYERIDPADRGLFSYAQLLGDWFPGPYGRLRSPASPVHVDQLPPRLRKTVGQVRFNEICFAQTVHFQPAEHMNCEAMDAAYLTADGQAVRSLPGEEAQYREFYADFLREAPPEAVRQLRIETPPGGGGNDADG
jgi:hypothetical protein